MSGFKRRVEAYESCADCIEYGMAREDVLIPAWAERSTQSGESPQQIVDRYMSGVHDRHLAGLAILPTPPPP